MSARLSASAVAVSACPAALQAPPSVDLFEVPAALVFGHVLDAVQADRARPVELEVRDSRFEAHGLESQGGIREPSTSRL